MAMARIEMNAPKTRKMTWKMVRLKTNEIGSNMQYSLSRKDEKEKQKHSHGPRLALSNAFMCINGLALGTRALHLANALDRSAPSESSTRCSKPNSMDIRTLSNRQHDSCFMTAVKMKTQELIEMASVS